MKIKSANRHLGFGLLFILVLILAVISMVSCDNWEYKETWKKKDANNAANEQRKQENKNEPSKQDAITAIILQSEIEGCKATREEAEALYYGMIYQNDLSRLTEKQIKAFLRYGFRREFKRNPTKEELNLLWNQVDPSYKR